MWCWKRHDLTERQQRRQHLACAIRWRAHFSIHGRAGRARAWRRDTKRTASAAADTRKGRQRLANLELGRVMRNKSHCAILLLCRHMFTHTGVRVSLSVHERIAPGWAGCSRVSVWRRSDHIVTCVRRKSGGAILMRFGRTHERQVNCSEAAYGGGWRWRDWFVSSALWTASARKFGAWNAEIESNQHCIQWRCTHAERDDEMRSNVRWPCAINLAGN